MPTAVCRNCSARYEYATNMFGQPTASMKYPDVVCGIVAYPPSTNKCYPCSKADAQEGAALQYRAAVESLAAHPFTHFMRNTMGIDMLKLYGMDGTQLDVTPEQNRDRQSRLRSNTVVGWHQTDEDCGSKILSSQRFIRGTQGLAGGGIYFAQSRAETDAKAHKRGCYLRANVQLGRVKRVHGGDSSITFSSLLREGYDSVEITGRASGNEWVVYNWDQVSEIRRG